MPAVGVALAATAGTAFVSGAVAAGALTVFQGVAASLLISVSATALNSALASKGSRGASAGISTEETAAGGDAPMSFILGDYATGGHAIAPAMSHGEEDGIPNAFLTYAISVSDVRKCTLNGIIVDGEKVNITGTIDPGLGNRLGAPYAGRAWVRFFDGAQTVAAPQMLANYSGYPKRPWQSDMILRETCWAIVTFRYDNEVFSALPDVRFEVGGIPLYDPRKDSTAGGSGAHRWATRSTWEQTTNPVVMIYNILKGIELTDIGTWGGVADQSELPYATWEAAMDACDALVAKAGGGTEKAYRAGLEVFVDQEPAGVIEELLKACSAEMAEVGGEWLIRVGPPKLPVYFFTDDDVIVSSEQDFTPFPSLDETYNGIHASYPDPDSLWEIKEAPPRYNAAYETADNDRRLVADLALAAVPYPRQVQRLMRAWIEEERRFRRHQLVLAPDAASVQPLDTISWSSARNGYVSKLFEVHESVADLTTGLVKVSVIEKDPSDYDWEAGFELPSEPSSGGVNVPAVQTLNWNVTKTTIQDASATDRRPALLLSWGPAGALYDVTGIQWQVRVKATAAMIERGGTVNVLDGSAIVTSGILPATEYEARGKLVAPRPTAWSAWKSATTDDIRIQSVDLAQAISQAISDAQGDATQAIQDAQDAQDDADQAIADALANDGNIQQINDVLAVSSHTNMLRNSGFLTGASSNSVLPEFFFSFQSADPDYQVGLREPTSTFSGGEGSSPLVLRRYPTAGVGSANIWTLNTPTWASQESYGAIVSPGAILEASANIGAINCRGRVGIQFRDASGAAVETQFSPEYSIIRVAGNPKASPRIAVIATVPPTAARATVLFQMYSIADAAQDSWLAVYQPMLTQKANLTDPPAPYTPSAAMDAASERAYVRQSTTALAQDGMALAQDTEQLFAEVLGPSGRLSAEIADRQTAISDEQQARALAITQTEAALKSDLRGSTEVAQLSMADIEGMLKSSVLIRSVAGKYEARIGVLANNNGQSTILLDARDIIASGTITAASGIIGALAVGTLNIAGEAVTNEKLGQESVSRPYNASRGNGGVLFNVNLERAGYISARVYAVVNVPAGGTTQLRLNIDGVTKRTVGASAPIGVPVFGVMLIASVAVPATAGSHSVAGQFSNPQPSPVQLFGDALGIYA